MSCTKVILTNQGKIKGKIISLDPKLTLQRCINFNNVPFARCERFERATPYGPWNGVWDGTGDTSKVPQSNPLVENNDACSGITMFTQNHVKLYNQSPVSEDVLHLKDLQLLLLSKLSDYLDYCVWRVAHFHTLKNTLS